MRKRLSSIVIILLFVVGSGLILYPIIGDYINHRHAASTIRYYSNVVRDTSDERLEAMLLQAQEYNRRLCGIQDPLLSGVDMGSYHSILDPTGTGVMGYIDIDRIGVELPIYHGTDKSVLQVGVGHIEGTSLPVGGRSTHCVLSGHRGLPSAKLFTDLDKMEIGDRFTITCLNQVLIYEVDQIKTVLPTESEDLLIQEGQDYCTLVTCTPYGINSHRLLVRGRRVETGETASESRLLVTNEALRVDKIIVVICMAIPLLLLLMIVFIIIGIHSSRKERANVIRRVVLEDEEGSPESEPEERNENMKERDEQDE